MNPYRSKRPAPDAVATPLATSPGTRVGAPESRRGGFTLLELLIAVAAFAIVLAAINTVFYGALRLRNRTAEAYDASLALQHTISLLRQDLANLLPPGGTLGGSLQTTPTTGSGASSSLASAFNSANSGSSSGSSASVSPASLALVNAATRPGFSSPEFTTTTGAIDETSPWSEVQRVAYYLIASTNGQTGRDLVRSVARNLLPSLREQPVVTPLLANVETIFFQYHDGAQWKDSWDSTTETTTRLPTAVRVQITLAGETTRLQAAAPIELIVPVLTYGGTNSTASSTGGSTGGTGGGGGGGQP